jgi:polar amino acid transport system substrate-binding protein
MRRVLLSFALIAGLSGAAFGQTSPASEIAPSGRLRVGMIAIAVLGGVAEPVARFIGQKLGVDVEPVMYPNPDAYLQSFGKGEWDVAIGPRALAPVDKLDSTSDLWIIDLVYVAGPGKQFPDIASVDRTGVKFGTIRGAPSDRVLTREIKAAEIVRIPLSPTIAADAAELLRSGKADVFGADSGVGYPAAEALPGGKVVPGPSQWFASRPHCREAALLQRRPRWKHLSTKQSKPTWCKEPSIQRASRAERRNQIGDYLRWAPERCSRDRANGGGSSMDALA